MRRIARLTAVALAVAIGGCSSMKPAPAKPASKGEVMAHKIRPPDQKPQAVTDDSILEANDTAAAAARGARAQARGKTFEEFAKSVYRDPGGKYIVNGDTTILDRKHLKEFYELNVAKEPTRKAPPATELIMGTANGLDTAWNSTDKKKITYCVSPTFGSRQAKVIADIAAATGRWEQCADVKFSHIAAEDTHCDESNGNVVFDVRPVNVNGQYLARAFFPNEPRAARNVLIDETSFQLPPGDLTLVGILRHELGHSLGLRHEQTRPEAGTCFEDNNWRPLTTYDKFSVMHYPQCNGGTSWKLDLTNSDQSGIACAYGPAPGFQIDTSICSPAKPPGPGPAGGKAVSRVFRNQRVADGAEKAYAVFNVSGGTRFTATMNGHGDNPGDPDLYVSFDQAPDVPGRQWSCRPYVDGPAETCALDVPASNTKAFVMVRGYAAGRYDLRVAYTSAP